MDGVILHTFVTDEALARCVAEVRAGAEEAGKDPASVRVWAVLATLHEPDHERLLRGVTGSHGHLLPGLRRRPRRDERLGSRLPSSASAPTRSCSRSPVPSTPSPRIDQLEHITTLIPEEWLPAAVGSAEQCAARVLDQLAAGADGVILHGSAPAELEPVVDAYRQVRPGRLRGPQRQPRPLGNRDQPVGGRRRATMMPT